MIRRLSTLAVIPLFLAACEPREEETVFDDEPAVAEERAHEVGDTETLNLSDIDDSGVTGDVRFTVLSQNETDVIVEVQDARPNTTYQVAIHQGTCENVGAERHGLDAIQTNERGDGASNTMLNTRLVDVMDGYHVVALYGERAEMDDDVDLDPTTDDEPVTETAQRPVACGEISEHGTGLGW
jgi:hypothetical protein